MARKQYMVEVEFIVSEAAGASDAVLGSWTRLNAYCAPRLLHGRLVGARQWDDDTSMRRVQVSRSRMDEMTSAKLAWWEGDDLLLMGYDHDGERIWTSKSQGGKTGNSRIKRSTRNTKTPARTPQPTPGHESFQDSHQESCQESRDQAGVLPGLPARESDCESDCGDKTTTTSVRAIDPRLVVVVAMGGRFDGDDGLDLTQQWLAVIDPHDQDQQRAIFRDGARILGHAVRFPNTYLIAAEEVATAALAASRADRSARVAEQQAAERAERDAGAAERDLQSRDRIRQRFGRLQTWLNSDDPNGTAVRDAIADNGRAREAMDLLRSGNAFGQRRLATTLPPAERMAYSDWLSRDLAPTTVAVAH